MLFTRARVGAWIESPPVQRAIILLIIVNAATLGLETAPSIMARFGALLKALDTAVLAVFVFEIGAKLYAFGPRFFRNGWNVFDFVVVGLALIPASGPLSVLRALRVLRVLRLVSTVPRLRFVVDAMLRAIPGIGSIGALMLLWFYVCAVMATGLFGGRFPEWFGSVGASMYTLFQVMTLESWSMGIVRPVMAEYPLAWLFFVPFILIATFTMLNLFIGIIVDTMQTMHAGEHADEVAAEQAVLTGALHGDTDRVLAELALLRGEVAALRAALGANTGVGADAGPATGPGAAAPAQTTSQQGPVAG